MYKRAAYGPEEQWKRKGVDSKPVRKRQCHEDKLVMEILAGDELTAEHMTFATALLKQQFPNLGGLQSTLFLQKILFSPMLTDIDCIQIHPTGQFHWVTASAAVNDTINVDDSNFVYNSEWRVCSVK